ELVLRATLVLSGQIERGVEMLLRAGDKLGHAIVHVIGNAPPLLLLCGDDLPDQRCQRLLVTMAFLPGANHDPGDTQDEQDLDGVQRERERSSHATRALE